MYCMKYAIITHLVFIVQVRLSWHLINGCFACVFCSNGDVQRHCKYVQLSNSRSVEGNGICQVSIPGVHRLPGKVSDTWCCFTTSSRTASILDCACRQELAALVLLAEHSSVELDLIETQSEINGRSFRASSRLTHCLFVCLCAIAHFQITLMSHKAHLGIFKRRKFQAMMCGRPEWWLWAWFNSKFSNSYKLDWPFVMTCQYSPSSLFYCISPQATANMTKNNQRHKIDRKNREKLQYYTPKLIKCLTPSLHIISLCAENDVRALLHFTQGIAEAKSILATTVCVSVCSSLHYHTTARTRK